MAECLMGQDHQRITASVSNPSFNLHFNYILSRGIFLLLLSRNGERHDLIKLSQVESIKLQYLSAKFGGC